MITLWIALAASAQANVKSLLLDCVVSNNDGTRQPLAILARGRESVSDFHDPSGLLSIGMGVYGTSDYWPVYWEQDLLPYFARGPHGENLGIFGGWTARVEPVKGSKAKATIKISNYNSPLVSKERPSKPDFVLNGHCTWREGGNALSIYKRLTK
jgi:hypothetical protein